MVHCTFKQQDVTGVEGRRSDPEENAESVAFIQRTQIDPCDEEHPQ